jgi:hypothetical protein
MKIYLNAEQSKILLEIAVKDLLPKELEKRKQQKKEAQHESTTTPAAS